MFKLTIVLVATLVVFAESKSVAVKSVDEEPVALETRSVDCASVHEVELQAASNKYKTSMSKCEHINEQKNEALDNEFFYYRAILKQQSSDSFGEFDKCDKHDKNKDYLHCYINTVRLIWLLLCV